MSAVISPCGTFRYEWERYYAAGLPALVVCMLNPSTADAETDDATTRKLHGFAERMACGSVHVVNAFAYRATNPVRLHAAAKAGENVYGPENWQHLARATRRDRRIFVGWGANIRRYPGYGEQLISGFKACGAEVWAFKVLEDGTPQHPLFVPYDSVPVRLA